MRYWNTAIIFLSYYIMLYCFFSFIKAYTFLLNNNSHLYAPKLQKFYTSAAVYYAALAAKRCCYLKKLMLILLLNFWASPSAEEWFHYIISPDYYHATHFVAPVLIVPVFPRVLACSPASIGSPDLTSPGMLHFCPSWTQYWECS